MEKFDPLTAGSQNVTRVHLSQVDFERTLPAFLDIHGYRQTVTRWSDAFKFTLGVANRVLHNSSALCDLVGMQVFPGRQDGKVLFIDDLNISVPRISGHSYANAIRMIILDMQLPFSMRVVCDTKFAFSDPIVTFHNPRPHDIPEFGSYIPMRRGRAPSRDRKSIVTTIDAMHDDLMKKCQRGEIVAGSWVSLNIPGVVGPERAFKLVVGSGDPKNGSLSVDSQVGKAVLGSVAGQTSSYQVRNVHRIIEIVAVDNEPLMRKFGFEVALRQDEREPEVFEN